MVLQRASQLYDDGCDMAGDLSLPCSVNFGVIIAKASLLVRCIDDCAFYGLQQAISLTYRMVPRGVCN